MLTGKQKTERAEDSEMGRHKYTSLPDAHLAHLLNIGWKPDSPLIRKYVQKHGLQELLLQWGDGNVGQ
jgi:hypothetical protein